MLQVYQLSMFFPQDEKFGLASQIRRAAVSITSNIADGFTRQSSKEKIQFYFVSKGSNTELQDQLLVAKDIGYISEKTFNGTTNQSIRVSQLINDLIQYCRK